MTSATDKLRRMLDERGVEWERGLPTETIVRKPIDVLYVERPDGRMHTYVRSYFTPAQAIAATLGNDGVGRSNDGVAELEAENAKLREVISDAEESARLILHESRMLQAENSKLRELLSEIAKLVTNPYGGCLRPGCANGCPHHLECNEELHTCFYVDRIRELGIEVDE